jgi:hypothetical protein
MKHIRSLLFSIAAFAGLTGLAFAANIGPYSGPMDYSQLQVYLNQLIAAMNPPGQSPRNVSTCGEAGNADAAGYTNQTPVITEVYIAEVTVPVNMTVTGVAIFNGTVASGNVKVGLANALGVNVATSASTASSGTASYQLVPFTSTYVATGPATYYIETFYDNTTVRPQALTVGSCGAAKQTGQTYATGFTTITPPTTFTTALGPVANLY